MTSAAGTRQIARKAYLTLEPLYVVAYASSDSAGEYAALGIDGSQFYFAVRSAPMGMVSAAVVASSFYNFSPQLIDAAIPSVWDRTTPQALYDARYARIDAHYRRALGDDVVESDGMAEAASLARTAATSLRGEGRPLFAGHAALPWPEAPHLQLFHAQMLLREHRGDGHIAALVLADLDALEALITHVGLDEHGFLERVVRATRGWSDDEWAGGLERTRARGLTDDDNQCTDAARELRATIEAQTDAAAAAPFDALGQAGTQRLLEIVTPWSQAIGKEVFGALSARA